MHTHNMYVTCTTHTYYICIIYTYMYMAYVCVCVYRERRLIDLKESAYAIVGSG